MCDQKNTLSMTGLHDCCYVACNNCALDPCTNPHINATHHQILFNSPKPPSAVAVMQICTKIIFKSNEQGL